MTERESEEKEGKVRYNDYLYRTLYPIVKMALTGQQVKAAAIVHRELDELQPIHIALRGAIRG